MPEPQHPFDQSTYQVRFDWGAEGLARLAPADVVVLVDVLDASTDVIASTDLIAAGGRHASADGPGAGDRDASADALAAVAPAEGLVLVGALTNASAVADAVLAEQRRRSARTSVAVIAVGDGPRFAMEDLLGAGAVIAALADRGIDHSSPEAAVACEAFRALRGAARHLLTASGSGRERADRADDVRAAAAVDASTVVPVLRRGAFVAL
ncbi:2-phosphosulfolactate phosphatase [Microbacterium sp. AZCO]|uniref:2-phosphosulfolactate phosphatase n=1 Tax=Microbacterium sp. AZCO TaxID=3142976 RepID=UPI0031F3ECE7